MADTAKPASKPADTKPTAAAPAPTIVPTADKPKPAAPAPAVKAAAPETTKPAPAPAKPPVAKAVPKPAAKKPAPAKQAKPAVAKPQPKTTIGAAPAARSAVKEKTMNDTIKTVTDKTQAAFAEAGDRTKGAWDKSARAFEDMNGFAKGNLEAMVESSKIAAKGFETMGQDAAAFAKKSYDDATTAMKSFAAVKSPTELMKLQSDFFRTSFEALVAETSRSTEKAMKLAGDIAQPLSNRAAVAADKVKVAA